MRTQTYFLWLQDIEFCQKYPQEAWELNVAGTQNIVDASKKVDAKIVNENQ